MVTGPIKESARLNPKAMALGTEMAASEATAPIPLASPQVCPWAPCCWSPSASSWPDRCHARFMGAVNTLLSDWFRRVRDVISLRTRPSRVRTSWDAWPSGGTRWSTASVSEISRQGGLRPLRTTQVSEEILKGKIGPRGHRQVVTILFSDVRNFHDDVGGMSPSRWSCSS